MGFVVDDAEASVAAGARDFSKFANLLRVSAAGLAVEVSGVGARGTRGGVGKLGDDLGCVGDFLSPTITQSVSSSAGTEETAMMGFSKGPG